MAAELDDGLLATARHAAKLWVKGELLKAQAREATLVASDLASAASDEAIRGAYDLLKVAGVSGRRGLLDELTRRNGRRPIVTPGQSVRRRRGSTSAWPRAEAWVYVLIGADGRTLYVGKSNEPRTRMPAHSSRGIPWVEVELIACSSEKAALNLEGDLIYQHQPVWNISDVRSRRKVVA